MKPKYAFIITINKNNHTSNRDLNLLMLKLHYKMRKINYIEISTSDFNFKHSKFIKLDISQSTRGIKQ